MAEDPLGKRSGVRGREGHGRAGGMECDRVCGWVFKGGNGAQRAEKSDIKRKEGTPGGLNGNRERTTRADNRTNTARVTNHSWNVFLRSRNCYTDERRS